MESSARGHGRTVGIATGVVLASWLGVWLVHTLVATLPASALDFFHVNREANLPTWWSAAMLLGVAGLAAAAGRLDVPTARPPWALVAVAALYFSLDEAAGIHELLAYLVPASDADFSPFLWLIPGSVLAAAGAVLLVLVGRRLPPRPRRGLLVGLALYLAGAVGIEVISGRLRDAFGIESAPYDLATVVEEGMEMAACVLAITVLAGHLRTLPAVRAYGGTAAALRGCVTSVRPGRAALTVVGGWLVLCLISTATLALLSGGGSSALEDLFDIRNESSVPMWWEMASLLAVAATAGIAAATEPDRRSRSSWTAVSVVFGLLSLSESGVVHERLAELPVSFPLQELTNPWVVPGALVAVAVVGALAAIVRPLAPAVRRRLVAGAGLLLGAAVLGQGFVGWLRGRGEVRAVYPVTVVEEALEISGIALALYAVLHHLGTQAGPIAPADGSPAAGVPAPPPAAPPNSPAQL